MTAPRPSGRPSSPHRLAYDDLDTTEQQRHDGAAASHHLAGRLAGVAERAVAGRVPSLHFDEYPREVAKRDIEVSEAAARLAGALHLHLD